MTFLRAKDNPDLVYLLRFMSSREVVGGKINKVMLNLSVPQTNNKTAEQAYLLMSQQFLAADFLHKAKTNLKKFQAAAQSVSHCTFLHCIFFDATLLSFSGFDL